MPRKMYSGPRRTFRNLNANETFIEYEQSIITIPIKAKLPGGEWEEEVLKLHAFMRLEVFPAYMNNLGTREFQFIIRDWDLFGYSPLLNKVFMGNQKGYLEPGTRATEGREQAVMTFRVARHYSKYGDDDNRHLATVNKLRINDITSHDAPEGDIYWQIERDNKSKEAYIVRFHNKPPNEKGIVFIDEDTDDVEYVLAEARGLYPGQEFKATLAEQRNTVYLESNTVLTADQKLLTPISIEWAMGKDPKIGTVGKVHVVSPAKSLCIADNGPVGDEPFDICDFPARINYSASYDIFINDVKFVADQAGIAICEGVDQIPPRDVLVAFQKPQAGLVLGQHIEFSAGRCTGMEEIGEKVYRKGCAMAEYYRNTRLNVQEGKRFAPFKYKG